MAAPASGRSPSASRQVRRRADRPGAFGSFWHGDWAAACYSWLKYRILCYLCVGWRGRLLQVSGGRIGGPARSADRPGGVPASSAQVETNRSVFQPSSLGWRRRADGAIASARRSGGGQPQAIVRRVLRLGCHRPAAGRGLKLVLQSVSIIPPGIHMIGETKRVSRSGRRRPRGGDRGSKHKGAKRELTERESAGM